MKPSIQAGFPPASQTDRGLGDTTERLGPGELGRCKAIQGCCELTRFGSSESCPLLFICIFPHRRRRRRERNGGGAEARLDNASGFPCFGVCCLTEICPPNETRKELKIRPGLKTFGALFSGLGRPTEEAASAARAAAPAPFHGHERSSQSRAELSASGGHGRRRNRGDRLRAEQSPACLPSFLPPPAAPRAALLFPFISPPPRTFALTRHIFKNGGGWGNGE